ncbi:hypothetical protein VNO77_05609 [Canavalia gladiata]|uniref:Uncharacterized protein n=1 Tax=Canavalia gladiata TaxID=3824 RepID=A0AAN9MYP2_CANGL
MMAYRRSRWIIGNGRSMRNWKDIWYPGLQAGTVISPLTISDPNATVAELVESCSCKPIGNGREMETTRALIRPNMGSKLNWTIKIRHWIRVVITIVIGDILGKTLLTFSTSESRRVDSLSTVPSVV